MYWSGTKEPSLQEVLADPIVHLVMARDGVTPDGLAALLRPICAGLNKPLDEAQRFGFQPGLEPSADGAAV